MKYAFFPDLAVRNPTFSHVHYFSSADFDQLLQQDMFRAALYLASADFYSELEKRGFEYEKLSNAQKNTLRKYFNRACFRPTPFGAFSSITSVGWTGAEDGIRFREEKVNTHLKLDYQPSLKLCEKILETEAGGMMRYRTNASLYKIFQHFRYIKYSVDDQQLKRSFSIISLMENEMISKVVDFCKSGRLQSEITGFLLEKTRYDRNVIESFVEQLIGEQIILPEWGGNITGEGCLEELLEHLSVQGLQSERIESVRSVLSEINMAAGQPQYLQACRQQLGMLLDETEMGKNIFYAVTERNNAEGGINNKYQQMILDGLYCLDKLVPFYGNTELENFKQAFTAKFEGREIPLLVALDPEAGIGYENQEAIVYGEGALLKDIHFDSVNQEREEYLQWTAGHALLLNKLHQQHENRDYRQLLLTEEDIAVIKPSGRDYELPPSISTIFRIHNEFVYLESAGGASATSLIGRFSSFGDNFLSMARKIAEREQSLNKNVIFAEIAHICDMHAANINRRKHIRQYELPVVTVSTLGEEQQLALSDIFISVRNNEIILRSKKLNAVIIPRLSSAFNHRNGSLPLFRFLCDLQYQGLKSSFKLELNNFFPGLRFYPRVVYKQTILSLATWYLSASDFSFLRTTDPARWYEQFNKLATSINLPRYFALTQYDNHLVFDRNDHEEVLLFLDAVRNYDSLTLTEFLMNEENGDRVTDSRGNPLISQYIAPLYLNDAVYNQPHNPGFGEQQETNADPAAGTDWLYFKIYCHPVKANELLCDVLMPLLNMVRHTNFVDKWFYIRYTDPDHHIRLRMHMLNGQSDILIALFSKTLKGLLDDRKIERYHLDTYTRELDRYAPASIEDIETFFFASSFFTVHYINSGMKGESRHSYDLDIIMLALEDIQNAFELTLEQRALLFEELYTGFYREFGETRNLKKSLEKKYHELRKEMNVIYENLGQLKESQGIHCSQLFEATKTVADKVAIMQDVRVEKLIGDMIHMHLNRLFVQNPRQQELIIYYLLYKHYTAMVYRKQLSR
ncbi:lantibiotic dehydratase [Chitinophaga tropicalis]|uniref:Lantibiotic dehydratase n=1 Tax=Chitinophaga tropicalis TaxID=2683588 RepID=A0A7K1UAV5_9BACT|nr:lantibiotic dehydratase [Chitinophaga tropicalis]MVT11408.1 hypothetical protein [Chitinophaga tropicalis]